MSGELLYIFSGDDSALNRSGEELCLTDSNLGVFISSGSGAFYPSVKLIHLSVVGIKGIFAVIFLSGVLF